MTDPATVHWSTLRTKTHSFTHADTIMFRNRSRQPCEPASMMHAGVALLKTRANTIYTGNENVRPSA